MLECPRTKRRVLGFVDVGFEVDLGWNSYVYSGSASGRSANGNPQPRARFAPSRVLSQSTRVYISYIKPARDHNKVHWISEFY
jgi:hypothetical protein